MEAEERRVEVGEPQERPPPSSTSGTLMLKPRRVKEAAPELAMSSSNDDKELLRWRGGRGGGSKRSGTLVLWAVLSCVLRAWAWMMSKFSYRGSVRSSRLRVATGWRRGTKASSSSRSDSSSRERQERRRPRVILTSLSATWAWLLTAFTGTARAAVIAWAAAASKRDARATHWSSLRLVPRTSPIGAAVSCPSAFLAGRMPTYANWFDLVRILVAP